MFQPTDTPVSEKIAEPNDSDLLRKLATAHNFDPASLDMNRQGRLTEAQRKPRARAATLKMSIGVVAVVLGVVGLYIPTGGIVVLLLGLVIGGILLRDGWQHRMDLLDGGVESETGRITKDTRIQTSGKGGSTTFYQYHIKGKAFVVSRKGYDSLPENKMYRVYYLRRSQQLINIEPVQV